MEYVPKCIQKEWENIQSIGIKTGTSLTLPIYNALPNPAGIIDTTISVSTKVSNKASKVDAEDNKEQSAEAPPAKKSKKSPLSRENVEAKAESKAKAAAKKPVAATPARVQPKRRASATKA
ncbi:hypothetical protein IWW47_004631 [Coemansia sp. RSA 2052]|nr:hypothetical protein IWW47_004631 [Coemansia sp. RSA 2052]